MIALVVALVVTALPGWAQDGIVNNPAEHFAIAPGGVDMRTGRYIHNETDLSIGDKTGGLALTRTTPEAISGHYSSFGNFANNWDVFLVVYPFDTQQVGANSGFRATLHNNGLTTTFDSTSNFYGQKSDGAGGKLTYTGGTFMGASTVYTYTGDDGTIIVFRPIGGADCIFAGPSGCAAASSVTRPDGTRYALSYASTGNNNGNYARLSKVESSRGYALVLEGNSGSGGVGSLITKACLYNLTLGTAPGSCTASALATATYSYSGMRLTSVTGSDGAISSFGYGAQSGASYTMQFYKPGAGTPWLTNTVGVDSNNEEGAPIEYVQAQSFADGRSYAYAFDYAPIGSFTVNYSTIVGGSYIDNLGRGTQVHYGFPYVPGKGPGDTVPCTQFPCEVDAPDQHRIFYQQTPGPQTITDTLGRTTTFDYCDPLALVYLPNYVSRCVVGPLQNFTDPEGIRTELTYYDRYVSQAKQIAKPGSGLANIVKSATYDCSQPRICGKPTSITDARGNTTNYTYKSENGEVLTESLPADPNGVRPVKRHEYVQRHAWLSNGAGGFVQAATPVWLLSTTRTCRTTATVNNACGGGTADEVVTSYDYGPNSGPNNLLLRGQTVTADGTTLRTCFTYDPAGNRISETSPRAGLAVCP
jgi:YD repeat-containing protein